MNATVTRSPHERFAAALAAEAPPTRSQLEEARQLRDMIEIQVEIAAATGSCSISMTIDDAAALARLLSDSIEAADAMGAH